MKQIIRLFLLIIIALVVITGCDGSSVDRDPVVIMDISVHPAWNTVEGEWLSGNIPINVVIFNGTANEIKLYINDQLVKDDQTPSNSGFQYMWDTSPLNEGSYKFTAEAVTSQGKISNENNLYVKHYLPWFYVSPDSASASLTKFEGDTQIGINNATATVNNINMEVSNYSYKLPNGTFHVNSGDNVTFIMQHPEMYIINESIEIPYTAQNLQTTSIDNWLNGTDVELIFTWDAPHKFNFGSWKISAGFYDIDRRPLGTISDQKIYNIGLNERTRKIPSSCLPDNTAFITLKIVSHSYKRLGWHKLGIGGAYNFDMVAEAESETIGNY